MKKKYYNIPLIVVIALVSMVAGSLITYRATKFNIKKNVTITETGISEAVDLVYDAVVTVESYDDKTYIGNGTGFIYKKDKDYAYLYTNHHVINGHNTIKVTFNNNKTVDAKVFGYDELNDIAILTIEAKNAPLVAKLGSAEECKLGDTVFTIGSPQSTTYTGTVTRGIISGKDRLVEVDDNTEAQTHIIKVLQTDAPINNGNSGGPLVNSKGEIIGIVTMKIVKEGVEGMGFAIPIEQALKVERNIRENISKDRPFIGVGFLDATNIAGIESYEIKTQEKVTYGSVVVQLQDNAPGVKSGLKLGDAVIKINDKIVHNPTELKYELSLHKVNETVKFTLIRDNKEQTVSIKLTEKLK